MFCNKRFLVLLMTVALVLCSCQKGHFMTDREYRNAVENDFSDRINRLELTEVRDFVDSLPVMEREAMEFLYAYMPYSDLADYSLEFFLSQTKYAFRAREEMSWGKDIPEDVFRHFVLVYRVNNENLDTARMVFYNALKDRVAGMSIAEAALEVNHWCHEQMNYKGSDGRTSAPLASLKTSYGRCGEESTFAVTALRSVGIPARQCYTPRWAHTDDNHAWVEVWTGDGWHYLGACEPDVELDMGWFSVPSSRCMMVHTKAFGRYHGDEEVVRETALYSELNLTSHYAKVKRAVVRVENEDGEAVPGVRVLFKIYNYAEYYTLADYTTDNDGCASLTTGLGDMLVWVTDGKGVSFAQYDNRNIDTLHVVFPDYASAEELKGMVFDFVMTPPDADSTVLKNVAESDLETLQKRLAYEDSLRTASFANRRKGAEIMPNENLTAEQIEEFSTLAEGNLDEIAAFLNNHREKQKGLYLYEYLRSYSDKDIRDISADMLERHLTLYDGKVDLSLWIKYVMPARISNELITDWRSDWNYVEPAVDDTGNYYNCPISPLGVQRIKVSDAHSRDICYVAYCRAHGVPAYLSAADGVSVYEWRDGGFSRHVFPGEKSTNDVGAVPLGIENMTYWKDYTIAYFDGGELLSLDYETDENMNGIHSYRPVILPKGICCLSYGERRDEKVYSQYRFFEVGDKNDELMVRSPYLESSVSFDGLRVVEAIIGDSRLEVVLGPMSEPARHLVAEMLEESKVNPLGNFDKVDLYVDSEDNADIQKIAAMNKNVSVRLANFKAGGSFPIVRVWHGNSSRLISRGYSINVLDRAHRVNNEIW